MRLAFMSQEAKTCTISI